MQGHVLMVLIDVIQAQVTPMSFSGILPFLLVQNLSVILIVKKILAGTTKWTKM